MCGKKRRLTLFRWTGCHLAASVLMVALAAGNLIACQITVRDSAFQTPRDVHLLCVMASAGDGAAKPISDVLSSWLQHDGKGLNLTLEEVDVDSPEVDFEQYGIPSAPPSLPVVVLVGRDYGTGRSFVIDHWEPEPSEDNLAVLRTSPAREAIGRELGKRVAVLLYAPGSQYDADAGQSTQQVLERVVEEWAEREALGVSVVRLDRTDPQERTLVSFIGLPAEGPDWVGVVFGQGKLISPPLVGPDITEDAINELIDQLGQDCSCSKPLPAMGVDMPLVWTDALDKSVLKMLETPPTESSDQQLEEAGSSLLHSVIWSVGALVAVVVVSSGGIWWWQRRHQQM